MTRRASTAWHPVAEARASAVVLGCSSGGVRALRTLLAGLARDLPVPLAVVCHTGAEDISTLCDTLSAVSPLPVREARERCPPEPGVVYLAPAGYHLLLGGDGCFALSVDARVHHCRPAIDVLFETAAAHHARQLVGVVLTGANEDGAAGLAAIRRAGGIGIVQDPADAEIAAMPEAALRVAGADHVLPLAAIAPLINQLCRPAP